MSILFFVLSLSSSIYGSILNSPPKFLLETPIRVLVKLKGELNLDSVSRENLAVNLENFYNMAFSRAIDFKLSNEEIIFYKPLWILNSFVIKAKPNIINRLVHSRQIDKIEVEEPKEIFELPFVKDSANVFIRNSLSWAITQIKADVLWQKGFLGENVLVAMIDTGANIKHSDLVENIWHNSGETGVDSEGNDKSNNNIDDDGNGYIDDVYGYNFLDNNNDILDNEGHGSQTAGIVAGNGANGFKTGVAPKAKLMILKSCCLSDNKIFESSMWEAIQYALKMGARVISMSLSIKPHANPSYDKWRRISEVILKSNLIHVNSAGNLGSKNVPNNIGAPANNPPAYFHPEQTKGKASGIIAVGATDENDEVRSYSSTGPVTWENIAPYFDYPYENGRKPGLIKPDICAPSGLRSLSMFGSNYTENFSGTSSATPVVAGAVALLLSYNPKLDIAKVTEALQLTAKPIGTTFNNNCGAGRIDIFSAYQYVRTKFKD